MKRSGRHSTSSRMRATPAACIESNTERIQALSITYGQRERESRTQLFLQNGILSKQGHILQTLKDTRPPVRSMRPLPAAAASASAHATRPSPATTLNPTPAKRSQIESNSTVTPEVADALRTLESQTNWESPEAFALFHPAKKDESTRVTLKHHVEKLSTILQEVTGYLNVIDGGDPNNVCSPSNIFDIRERCRYLWLAYEITLNRWEYYGVNSWCSCCDEAVKWVNEVNGSSFVKDGETIMRWNVIFQESGYFPHPNQALQLGKKPEPSMIAKFPEVKDQITEFCLQN